MSASETGPAQPGRRIVVTGTGRLSVALAGGLGADGHTIGVLGPGAPTSGVAAAARRECGFASPEEIRDGLASLIAELGGVDQLVHAWVHPGLLEPAAFAELSEETWVSRCEATLAGAWWLAQEAAGHLRAAGRG